MGLMRGGYEGYSLSAKSAEALAMKSLLGILAAS